MKPLYDRTWTPTSATMLRKQWGFRGGSCAGG